MKINKITAFIVMYVVTLCVLSFAGYYFYADYSLEKERLTVDNEGFHTDLSYIDLPRIAVTLNSDHAAHSGNIRMDITLEVDNRYANQISGYSSRITDRLVRYTQTLDYDELKRPRQTVWLKQDILNEVNRAGAPAPIKDIIFRQFVLM